MNRVFELPHIFIVFQPGTGGNFVAGMLSKLIGADRAELTISNNGSSHTIIDRKVAGTDYLSFGTTFEDQAFFASPEQRLNHYLEKIKELDDEITAPQVVWSHDFTNIPLYQKFFPNSKVLVITQDSDLEKLVAVSMNITKNWMDPNHSPPFPLERWADAVSKTDFVLELGLRNLVGEQKSKNIVQNKFDDANHNIIKFVRLHQMLIYYRLLPLLDKNLQPTVDVANTVLFRLPWEDFVKNMHGAPYKIGKPYKSYINEQCTQLPYSYLIEDNVNLLIDAVQSLVGHLAEVDQIFIVKQFNKYRNMQDQVMLTNPYKFYSSLKNSLANLR